MTPDTWQIKKHFLVSLFEYFVSNRLFRAFRFFNCFWCHSFVESWSFHNFYLMRWSLLCEIRRLFRLIFIQKYVATIIPNELVSATFSFLNSLDCIFSTLFSSLIDGELALFLDFKFFFLQLFTQGNILKLAILNSFVFLLNYFGETVPSFCLVDVIPFYFRSSYQNGLQRATLCKPWLLGLWISGIVLIYSLECLLVSLFWNGNRVERTKVNCLFNQFLHWVLFLLLSYKLLELQLALFAVSQENLALLNAPTH